MLWGTFDLLPKAHIMIVIQYYDGVQEPLKAHTSGSLGSFQKLFHFES